MNKVYARQHIGIVKQMYPCNYTVFSEYPAVFIRYVAKKAVISAVNDVFMIIPPEK